MNREDAIKSAQVTGTGQAERLLNLGTLDAALDRIDAVQYAQSFANEFMDTLRGVTATSRGVARDAYVRAFVDAQQLAHNALPEVKAAYMNESIAWHIEAALRGTASDIKKFKEAFDGDPEYAFRWADKAMDAAAVQNVYLRIKGAVDRKDCSLDQLLKNVTDEALRGAEFPSSSTSSASNYMAKASTSAYAQFARFLASVMRSGE